MEDEQQSEPFSVEGVDIESLGPSLRGQLERLQIAEGSFLPVAAVTMQGTLALLDDDQLFHVIIGAAIQVAARRLGTETPPMILERALGTATKSYDAERWREQLGPEVRRIIARAREAAAEPNMVAWAAGELKHLADELRLPHPVDAPVLSDALRSIADALGIEAAAALGRLLGERTP